MCQIVLYARHRPDKVSKVAMTAATTTNKEFYVNYDGEAQAGGRLVTLAALGAPAAGKTTMLARIHTPSEYLNSRVVTVGVEFLARYVKLRIHDKDCVVKLILKDVGGQDRFMTLVPKFCQDLDGAFIVFDATSRESFDKTAQWAREIQQYSAHALCALVAAKYDAYSELDASSQPKCHQWMDDYDMNAEAQRLGCKLGFFKVSALTEFNLVAVTKALAEAAYLQTLQAEQAAMSGDALDIRIVSSQRTTRHQQTDKKTCLLL